MKTTGQGVSSGITMLCLLAKAIIEFNRGHWKESLTNIKAIIRENPRSPCDIWFAMGLCYYRLGNLPKAKISFDRTVEMDPENSMALAALGIVEITANINDFESHESSATFFERAFRANPRNPLALKYLAEHYFFKGGESGLGLAKSLAEAGLEVLKSKNRPERAELTTFRGELDHLRSSFYFTLGKIEHAQLRYQGAF